MADIPEVFNHPGAAFVTLPAGIKFPPPYKEWQEAKTWRTFERARKHGGNVGIIAGNGYIGLDKDNPAAFDGLELPTTTTWETRPGRLGMRFACADVTPELLAEYGKPADHAQFKLFKDGKACGEVKLQRTYQVIPPSHKYIDPVTGDDAPPGKGNRVDYKLLDSSPPATITLAKLLADLQAIGITFSSKLEATAAKPESIATKAYDGPIETDPAKMRNYALAALRGEADLLAGTTTGERNNQLYKSAANLGEFVPLGALSEGEIIAELALIADDTGLDLEEIKRTIRSGLKKGKQHPRNIPKAEETDNPKELWEATPDEAEALLNAVMEERGYVITEAELEAYRMPSGPKFSCNLPADHFITRYIGYGKEISDAYPDYWLAGAIHELAVVSDKKIKFVIKQDTIYTNLYIYIAGGSTLARKTTALKKSDNMILMVKGQNYLNTKVPNEFSPEAFIEHMDQFNHSSWVRDEAAGVLSLMKKDYMRGFKDTLMQLYDCTPITRMLRTSQRKADKTNFNVADPFINVFFCSTDAALGANTELNDTLSGFLARFLFFFPQGEKDNYMPLEKGAAAHSALEEIVRAQLSEIAAKMDSMPECVDMDYTPEARAYYNEWQNRREHELARLKDGFSSQIFGRLMPTVVKLAMLFELGSQDFDVNRPIRFEYFVEACRLVDEYFLPTARAVYDLVGSNAEKAVIDRIIAFLKRNGGKATRRAISRDTKIKSKELDEYLSTMIGNGSAFQREVLNEETGRKATYIFLGDVSMVPNVPNVSNVPNVPKQDCTRETKGTLAQLETKETRETIKVDVKESELSSPTIRKEDPGFTKFQERVRTHRRNTCLWCGQHFEIPLVVSVPGGFICAKCEREGKPSEPVKPDSQMKLKAESA